MAHAMAQETIFVQTDPAFNIVLESLTELRNQGRLIVTHMQTASIENIESNDRREDWNFRFGGQRENVSVHAFACTASAVARMCMLEATGILRELWPNFGPRSKQRNKAKLVPATFIEDPNFIFADNKFDARRYWSRYDQLYPHFLIEDEILSVGINTPISLPRMMFIFRRNFTEVIEITTTFDATKTAVPQEFNSYVHVTCIVRSIAENDIDHKFTKYLKDMIEMSRPISIPSYFVKIREVKTKKDLPNALEHLTIKEKEEEEEKKEKEKKEVQKPDDNDDDDDGEEKGAASK